MFYLKNVCFICLSDIFITKISSLDTRSNTLEHLKFVLPELNITEENHSTYICTSCCNRVSSFNDFKQQCVQNFSLLKEFDRSKDKNCELQVTLSKTTLKSKASPSKYPKRMKLDDKIDVKPVIIRRVTVKKNSTQNNAVANTITESEKVKNKIYSTIVINTRNENKINSSEGIKFDNKINMETDKIHKVTVEKNSIQIDLIENSIRGSETIINKNIYSNKTINSENENKMDTTKTDLDQTSNISNIKQEIDDLIELEKELQDSLENTEHFDPIGNASYESILSELIKQEPEEDNTTSNINYEGVNGTITKMGVSGENAAPSSRNASKVSITTQRDNVKPVPIKYFLLLEPQRKFNNTVKNQLNLDSRTQCVAEKDGVLQASARSQIDSRSPQNRYSNTGTSIQQTSHSVSNETQKCSGKVASPEEKTFSKEETIAVEEISPEKASSANGVSKSIPLTEKPHPWVQSSLNRRYGEETSKTGNSNSSESKFKNFNNKLDVLDRKYGQGNQNRELLTFKLFEY